ncbi:hypothetical protein CGRA01v4_15025 [Colletotrichum graminicola]|uniref:Uncharacterized protein n=1 Tax=Colletotrichum graminicola (strain M1.001 / M2 / FGSC 10212) TaxID=645133 RepID=E3QYH0_COLGM|nr:uncharacterized protein GLRG_11016 [Colletotrichum graminicola M1.001]EFQ35908.1 hypothetical protein GLRG_11016 [Colletotrichum graminicola M1.001]WDK23733.1 hypothetical protein CGRA01v4_15025 [Colletotrichum graminicola]
MPSSSRREDRERENKTYRLLQAKVRAEAEADAKRHAAAGAQQRGPAPDEAKQRRVRFSDTPETFWYTESTPEGQGSEDGGNRDYEETAISQEPYEDHHHHHQHQQQQQHPAGGHRGEKPEKYSFRDAILVASGATLNWTTSHHQDCRVAGSLESAHPGHGSNNKNNKRGRLGFLLRLLRFFIRHYCVVLAVLLGIISWVVLAWFCDVVQTRIRSVADLLSSPLALPQAALSGLMGAAWGILSPSAHDAGPWNPSSSTAAADFSPIVPDLSTVLGVVYRTESGVNALSEMTTNVQRDTQLNSAMNFLFTMYEATDLHWIAHLREEELGLSHLTLQLQDFAERAGRKRRVPLPWVLCRVPLVSGLETCRASADRFDVQMQTVLDFLSEAKEYRNSVYNNHMTAPAMHKVSRLVCRLGDSFGRVSLGLRETVPDADVAGSPLMDAHVLDTYLQDQQDGLRMSCHVIVDIGSEMADKRKQMDDDIKMLTRMTRSIGHIRLSVADNTLQVNRACKAVIKDLGMLTERLNSW